MRSTTSDMSATLVLPQGLYSDIIEKTRHPLETAGVLLVSIIKTDNTELRLLGRKILWVEDCAYDRRENNSLSIASVGYINALGMAETMGAGAIWVHTHPGIDAEPRPSNHDKTVDREIGDLFRLRSASAYYGTLIFSPRAEGFAFTGYIEPAGGNEAQLRQIWIVGDRFHLIQTFDSKFTNVSQIFDRNVRAFGGSIQHVLSNLHVAVVGCGGTGSAVAEQLVRLGVRQLTLIDPEQLSSSNVTRVYGSTPEDVGKPKVNVLSHYLKQIAPEALLEMIQGTITTEAVARRLIGCDVVFGCTDDNAGRLVLSRFATYLLTPVIDCGVIISNDDHLQITGINGRVTVLVPGQACLVCRGRIDLARASAELLSFEERMHRQQEGYAPALGRIEPAVVAFTTIVGATAVSELLERLVGYGPEPRPSEVLLRFHEREISTNLASPHTNHYCQLSSGKLGIGMTTPFLEQTWPN
jgi:hypothetical protein